MQTRIDIDPIEPLSYREILRHSKPIVFQVINFINDRIEEEFGLEVEQPSVKDVNNITRALDKWVHRLYFSRFKEIFGTNVHVTGEEESKKRRSDWCKTKNIIASIDALDGTDLVFRGLYNWCTALFFFYPNNRVIASMAGVPSGTVYYASEAGAYKAWTPEGQTKKKVKKVMIPHKNRISKIKDASICFYGQKAKNFLSIFSKKSFVKLLKQYKETSSKQRSVPFRIYNLGGNPMMIKLAEGKIDAVIEIEGQKLYDVIPGAFIAVKAGAFWGDLNGKHIDDAYLKNILAKPTGKLSYILASSEKLYKALLQLF